MKCDIIYSAHINLLRDYIISTGMETAEYLQLEGNDVTNMDMLDAMGAGAFPLLVMDETAALAKAGVRTMPGHKLVEIRKDCVIVEDNADVQVELPCEIAVMSLGVKSYNPLEEALSDRKNIFVLGEAKVAGQTVSKAVHTAFETACNLE